MHFVDAKGILTGSGDHYGRIYTVDAVTAVFIATAEAGVISLHIPLKILR